MNNINLNILTASVAQIKFTATESGIPVTSLDKNSIKVIVNNTFFEDYDLIINNPNEYTLNMNTSLDYYDVVLLYIKDITIVSDVYVIYFHQMFYQGECINLLPTLPIDENNDIKLITNLIKTNDVDLNNISGSTSFLSGVGRNSSFTMASSGQVNVDIPIEIYLKNKNNVNVPNSEYIINIKIDRI